MHSEQGPYKRRSASHIREQDDLLGLAGSLNNTAEFWSIAKVNYNYKYNFLKMVNYNIVINYNEKIQLQL